ncbi:flagellar hook-length control protein FliK [Paenibacillus dakarensis]|uniref:flagellar hook-length control protein FliK n=1 Tax=Paenibacillus dakarensis TaxID=1527293 RepID=UPI0006D57A19|nr:flagellar hook-length control protein FliK [Paenibacillus dakarensis]
MTLIFQGLTSGVNGAVSPDKSANNGGTSTGEVFGQVLGQQMSNAAAPSVKDTAALMLDMSSASMFKGLSVPSLSGEAVETTETAVTEGSPGQDNFLGLSDLILSLLKDLEKLEEALEEDPSLLQQLQNWLQQAASILNGAQVQGEGQQSGQVPDPQGEMQIISPLAAHSETIRFAVLDAITQLNSLLKNNGMSEQAKPQLMQLAQSFSSLLTGKGDETSKQEAHNRVQAIPTVNNKVSIETLLSTDKAELPVRVKPAVRLEPMTEGKVNLSGNGLDGSASEEAGASGEITSGQHTMTAGQLVLRSGTNTPVQPVAQPVPVEQFAKEMTNLVVNKLEFVKLQGFTEARISLNPEHLGQVDIKITMQNGHLVAQFMTRNSDAKELIDQQMSQLRSALQGQGLQVEKLEVTQSSQTSSSQLYQDGRQPGSGQQNPNRRSRERDAQSDDAIAAAAITEEWNEWLAEREEAETQVHSGSFTATV